MAPAWPADRSRIGIPPRMSASITSHDSVANLSGGTTKQLVLETKGRARQAASEPATRCSISSPRRARSTEVNEVPMCLVVPWMQT